MRRTILAAMGGLMLCATPAAAQDMETGDEKLAEFSQMMAQLFPREELTEEQEARLPLATQAVSAIVPEGIYKRIMDEVMGKTMAPLMQMLAGPPRGSLAGQINRSADGLMELTDEELAEVASILDPDYKQRSDLQFELMMSKMGDVMVQLEPGLREGLARAYASRFTAAELADLNTFFATPSGQKYAAESLVIFSDPQVMGASMKAMPMIMGSMGEWVKEIEEATGNLRAPRTYADLSAAERSRLAGLVGLSENELKAQMLEAEEIARMMAEARSADGDDWTDTEELADEAALEE